MPIIDNKKKIIILYTRLSPHSYSLFENMLLNKYISLEIFASCGNDIGNYFEYPNSKLKIHSLVSNNLKNFKKILITLFQQDVEAIYISGWQYLTYIFCVSFIRILRKEVRVVSGFDDMYFPNKFKHKYLLPLFGNFFRLLAPFAWVSGHHSNLFAKQMGYKNTEIIPNLLSAPNDYKYVDEHSNKFIFIGREDYVKGLDILIAAWKIFRKEFKNWRLEIVGTKAYNNKKIGIYSHGYKDQNFITRLLSNGGVGIVPSRRDQWCVVVHEFLSSGIPVIVSSNVGCIPDFFKNDYPLKFFQNDSYKNLLKIMRFVANMEKDEIYFLKKSCYKSSELFSSKKSADTFISYVLNGYKNEK